MGDESIHEESIQMQPVLSLKPKDVQQELDGGTPFGHFDGGPSETTTGHFDGGAPPEN